MKHFVQWLYPGLSIKRPIQPAFWQVFALAMAVAIIIPMALTTVVYQRKFRQGTLQIV